MYHRPPISGGLFAEVLGVLSVADLGFGTAMTYSFYIPIAENDTKKIVQLMRFYKIVCDISFLEFAISKTKLQHPKIVYESKIKITFIKKSFCLSIVLEWNMCFWEHSSKYNEI